MAFNASGNCLPGSRDNSAAFTLRICRAFDTSMTNYTHPGSAMINLAEPILALVYAMILSGILKTNGHVYRHLAIGKVLECLHNFAISLCELKQKIA